MPHAERRRQAFEYQLAKNTTFDAASLVRSGGAIDTYVCAKPLPAGTKLYWRVRAVTVSGVASQ